MGAGLGFTKDSMNGSRSNRKLLKDVKERHFKTSIGSGLKVSHETYQKATPELLKKIKAETLRANRIENLKILGITLFVLFIGWLIYSYFIG